MARASAIRQIASARCAPRVAAAFAERIIQIWDFSTLQPLSEFNTVFGFGGHRVTLNATGDVCVAAGWAKGKRGGVACYDALTGSLVWHRTDIRQTQFVRFSCDGTMVWCGVETGRFQKLDARTGLTLESLVGVKKVFDSPHGNCLLLETRHRGFVVKGATEVRVPNLSFALLDAAFSPKMLCLSEAGGPVRCLDCHSGVELWRYEPPRDTHVLRLQYRPTDERFYGVQWEYQQGRSRTLFRLGTEAGHYEEICGLSSWEEEFCMDGDALITSSGDVISLPSGAVAGHLAFPQKDYPEPSDTLRSIG